MTRRRAVGKQEPVGRETRFAGPRTDGHVRPDHFTESTRAHPQWATA